VYIRNIHHSVYTSISHIHFRRGSGDATHAVSTATIDEVRIVFGNASVEPTVAFYKYT